MESAVALIDEGNTIPFIARYRKEATGSLDDQVLRTLNERLEYLRNLDKRREEITSSIREQEKLTPELEAALIGLRRHKDSVSGLLRAQDAVLGKDCALTAPTLEQLMVYLEREAEK